MKILKGKVMTKPNFLIYGEAGIGKSAAAMEFMKPLFIGNEPPMHSDAHKLPPATTLEMFEEQLKIAAEDTEYKTLVIDTIDGVEELFKESVCPNSSRSGYGGFGRYWSELEDWWCKMDKKYLTPIRKVKTIVILSHQKVKIVQDVGSEKNYSQPRIETRLFEYIVNRMDGIFYIMANTSSHRGKKSDEIITKEQRRIYTRPGKYWLAKNRWDLQEFYQFDLGITIGRIRSDIADYYKTKEVNNGKA